MDSIDKLADPNNLIKAYQRAVKASGWKEPTQRFGLNLLKEVRRMQQDIQAGSYQQKGGSTFRTCEHGHLRLIKALGVRDSIMQHALCDDVLIPGLCRFLIHDNGASLQGKGIAFTRRRLEQHLHRYYRRHGTDGYVLLIDFRKYFDNIQHDKLEALIHDRIPDERLRSFLHRLLAAYRVDVSHSDTPDILSELFNSLEYEQLPAACRTGRRWMGKSLGIGSPVSQIAGIFFPTAIDTYCKTVRQCQYYEVYMDDRIVIHPDKAFLSDLLVHIRQIASGLGLFINEKKTQIIKLSHGFTFLKTKYLLTESGHIVRRIPHDVVTGERRKLKKLARFVVDGDMELEDFEHQYQSWRGDKRKYHAYHTLVRLDRQYKELITWIKTNRKNCSRSIRKSATSRRSCPVPTQKSETGRLPRPMRPA